MFKKLQVLIMIFCLGIFIFPKQNFYAQNMENMDCCKTEVKDTSCHDTENKDSNKETQNHCKDCANCNHCISLVNLNINKPETLEIEAAITAHKKAVFIYNNPHLSFNLQEIWQPPKIG